MPYVYILTNTNNTVFYTGSTPNLQGRMWEHKQKLIPHSFPARYNLCKLLYFEEYENIQEAAQREYQIKRWKREYKKNLIETQHPGWQDLSADWFGE